VTAQEVCVARCFLDERKRACTPAGSPPLDLLDAALRLLCPSCRSISRPVSLSPPAPPGATSPVYFPHFHFLYGQHETPLRAIEEAKRLSESQPAVTKTDLLGRDGIRSCRHGNEGVGSWRRHYSRLVPVLYFPSFFVMPTIEPVVPYKDAVSSYNSRSFWMP